MNTTWVGLGVPMDLMAENSGAYALAVFGSAMRSKVYLTSALVNFSPLWNTASSTRSNVHEVGVVAVHFVASSGTNSPAGSIVSNLLKMLS